MTALFILTRYHLPLHYGTFKSSGREQRGHLDSTRPEMASFVAICNSFRAAVSRCSVEVRRRSSLLNTS